MLNKPIRTQKNQSNLGGKHFLGMEHSKRQKIMTNPYKRYQYFREFYDADRATLIEVVARTYAPKLHQQMISLMRALIHENREGSELQKHRRLEKEKAIKFIRNLTVKKQVDFNNRFEKAMFAINQATGKNYYLRDWVHRGGSKEADLSMYLNRQEVISIADKAKIRYYVIEVKKQLMLEKQSA